MKTTNQLLINFINKLLSINQLLLIKFINKLLLINQYQQILINNPITPFQ
jgi:hypothetical protein